MKYATNVEEAAKYIILFLRGKNIPNFKITPFRVLKLLYASYAWTLVASNNKIALCEEPPRAWKLGPVFESLWKSPDFKTWVNDPFLKSQVQSTILESVMNRSLELYYDVPEETLFVLFHDDPAWKKQRENLSVFGKSSSPLNKDDIFNYYSSIARDVAS